MLELLLLAILRNLESLALEILIECQLGLRVQYFFCDALLSFASKISPEFHQAAVKDVQKASPIYLLRRASSLEQSCLYIRSWTESIICFGALNDPSIHSHLEF